MHIAMALLCCGAAAVMTARSKGAASRAAHGAVAVAMAGMAVNMHRPILLCIAAGVGAGAILLSVAAGHAASAPDGATTSAELRLCAVDLHVCAALILVAALAPLFGSAGAGQVISPDPHHGTGGDRTVVTALLFAVTYAWVIRRRRGVEALRGACVKDHPDTAPTVPGPHAVMIAAMSAMTLA